MRDVLTELEAWWRAGDTVGLGTVVGTWKSSPRQPGAAMLVGPDGTVVGSVSGGCVEGAVFELAAGSRDGGSLRLQRYGISDDDAFEVGLTCGGIIDIFVEPVNRDTFPELGEIAQDVRDGVPVAVATLVAGDETRLGKRLVIRADRADGSLGSQRLDDAVRDDVRGMLEQGKTGLMHYGPDGERRGDELTVFVNSFAPPPRMIVFGAIDFAAAVARAGSFLGYRVTVCDARAVFATVARFPMADEVVSEWPDRYLAEVADSLGPRDAVCVLTHDAKFDVPAITGALDSRVGYLGAMGSRATHARRVALLRKAGIGDDALARVMAPIGLDIGSRTPEETAVAVCAEIIALRTGHIGAGPLRDGTGPIH